MLLFTRRLFPLFVTQFLGAFNDNVFKNSLVILITYSLASGANARLLITIASGLFILPFFIFSATAGQLADKYDRAFIARITKIIEVLVMIMATFGFYIGNASVLIGILFASGVQSTFFGPVKYAILPQLLAKDELLTGNAYIESGTFLAILLGTIIGGLLIILPNGPQLVSYTLLSIAVFGVLASRYIPKAPAPDKSLSINPNIATETIKILRYCRHNMRVLYCILAISWFWLIGATFLAQFPTFVKDYLHAEAKIVTLFLTLFTVGIAIGTFLCAKLQRGQIKTFLVPYAAIGMSVFIIDLYFASNHKFYNNLHALLSYEQFLHMVPSMRVMLDILLLSIFGGVYIVPLYTVVQHESDNRFRARIIAGLNVYNALFMVTSALFVIAMLTFQRSIPEAFLALGIFNIIVVLLLFRFL